MPHFLIKWGLGFQLRNFRGKTFCLLQDGTYDKEGKQDMKQVIVVEGLTEELSLNRILMILLA